MRAFIRVLSSIFIITSLLFSGAPDNISAAHVQQGYVNTKNTTLNVRAGAGNKYKVIGKVSKGAIVDIIGFQKGWYKIRYGNITGYVMSSYIAKIDVLSPQQAFDMVRQTDDAINKIPFGKIVTYSEAQKLFPYVATSYLTKFLNASFDKQPEGWTLCACDAVLFIQLSLDANTKVTYSSNKNTMYLSEYIYDELKGNHSQTITLSKTTSGWRITNISEKYQ
ncbi:hypothetical protein AM501_08255 [Aneurinibacillus migulanus]|uniref:SH3 domain-containing protein n=1 Tax=Aneurinibacillus migulanus TaxID=47500 RepID=UPI0006B4DD3B|nr:SH3 domain-containing protein [Aneurinibacillus migulanus]KPD08745.1 hypothetical protein AM501_08255 [Aneurinibacillus migulanus]MCP1358484.1 SH3 domain-containing protein [Aneurinibacillus migulanus]